MERAVGQDGGQTPGQGIGNYRLVARVGVGLDTEVWQAEDVVRGRTVALKLYPSRFALDWSFVQRLKRTARVAAELRHPNLLPCLDAGAADGRAYVASPLAADGSLAQRLAGQPWTVDAAITLLGPLASGLDAMHGQNGVHRNLKPSNVLFDGSTPLLCDILTPRPFDPLEDLAQFGHLALAPEYAAPEQVAGDATPSSRLSDLYSFGALAFELLTGRPPFVGPSTVGVLYAHIAMPLPSAADLNPALPAAVDLVLGTMLAKDPCHRFASAVAFVTALGHAISPTWQQAVGGVTGYGHNLDEVRQPGRRTRLRWREL
ncbi:MAG: serine/threonine protein kinase [Chloroflexi bacterium]|nr:serine/threonine protein kinase [Chloroflexota bacterium]